MLLKIYTKNPLYNYSLSMTSLGSYEATAHLINDFQSIIVSFEFRFKCLMFLYFWKKVTEISIWFICRDLIFISYPVWELKYKYYMLT